MIATRKERIRWQSCRQVVDEGVGEGAAVRAQDEGVEEAEGAPAH